MNLQPSKHLQNTFMKANLLPSPAIYAKAGGEGSHEGKRLQRLNDPQPDLPGTVLEPHVRRCPLHELPACLATAKQEGYWPFATERHGSEYLVQFIPDRKPSHDD